MITVDIAVDLPDALRERAVALSALLVGRMRQAGRPSSFELGRPFPGEADVNMCQPHISLFMLRIDESRTGDILRAVESVAAATRPVFAAGDRYHHNPQGAPELAFHRSTAWRELQRAVVAAAEPLREGRLRDVDPAGEELHSLIAGLRRDDPGGARLRQLLRYGYDEISDGVDDRFLPHITFAWPAEPVPPGGAAVDLAGLPAPELFTGALTEVAVYRMSPNGTCTHRYGGCRLRAPTLVATAGAPATEPAYRPAYGF
jgi:hypothetical protein